MDKYLSHVQNSKQDKPSHQARAKKTDEIQPDDDEVEEEFEADEPETQSTSRPASKLDLEEPITTSQNGDDNEEDDEVNLKKIHIERLKCFAFELMRT